MTRLRLFLLAAAILAAALLQPAAAETAPATDQQAQARAFIERFRAANTTHDGKLTRPQAEAANMTGIVRAFPQIDTRHKGFITLEDIRSFAQRRRQAAAPAETE